MAWVVIAAIGMFILAITFQNELDQASIERIGAKGLHSEFLAITKIVSRILAQSDDIHNVPLFENVLHEIVALHPNVGLLFLYELSPYPNARIYSSDSGFATTGLSEYERNEIAAGRMVFHRYEDQADRGWVITGPILVNGYTVAALQGRYSLQLYDELLRDEGLSARQVGFAVVVFSSLVFIWLIRSKIQRPMSELIHKMRQAEAGNLTGHVQIRGPADIQELANQFNQMLDRIRTGLVDREWLHGEIRGFNEKLIRTVSETKKELVRKNQELVEARLTTERASKLAALGELSAVMAHELGNPLNAMSGHLQLLQKEMHFQEPNRHLTIIRDEITRMTSIIQQILDSTHTKTRPIPVDLNAVIQDVLVLIAPSLAEGHILLKTDLAPSLPLVAGDYQALHGVLFNLAANAIQAMPHGGELAFATLLPIDGSVEKSVFFQGARLNESAVRLIVCDSGCGIAPEHLPRVFQPFFTTKHAEGGTGLGLAVCQRVIVSLGGCIGVESIIGQGTKFTVDLPLWRAVCEKGRSSDGV